MSNFLKRFFLNAKMIFVLSAFMGAILFSACIKKGGFDLNNRDRDFDAGWKFACDSTIEAQNSDFNDAAWRVVDLPHDWSIEELPNQNDSSVIGPFTKSSIGAKATGHVVGGIGWYRKKFTVEPADSGKIFYLNFDGVYMESDVWVNGKHVGCHAYGYTPFYYNISDYLNKNTENTIAVRVKNLGKNSRWYSGSGIYRHVQLSVVNPVHLSTWGIEVKTPEISALKAKVVTVAKIENFQLVNAEYQVRASILDGKIKNIVAETINKLNSSIVSDTFSVENPKLWSTNTPNLYILKIEILKNGKIIDAKEQLFGIRSVEFSTDKGFLLNGISIEMKGGCLHHDNGLLGSATFDRAEERRIEIMKANGFNAIRTSHNPPSHQFLDACDRLGMLVIDEAFDMWEHPKNPQDYSNFFKKYWKSDLESMILRDRNHPSVVIWSIGNEIYERADTSGVRIAEQLTSCIHSIDSTRPITAAICEMWDHPGKDWTATAPAFKFLNIGGYNYKWQFYESDHKLYPTRLMMGTESVPKEAFENWQLVEKCSWVIGDFVWTGMDYLGETGIGHVYYGTKDEGFMLQDFPWFNAWCGDIDICGNKKPQSYYRDVVWNNSDLEIFVHKPIADNLNERSSFWGWPEEIQSWNWKGNEGKNMKVNVYSRYPKVQLKLNGKTIGEKNITDSSKLTAVFEVPYEPGELKAIGINAEGVAKTDKSLITTGKISKIILSADRAELNASRNDLSYISIEVADEKGRLVIDEPVQVKVTLTGNGELIALGNAAPNDMKSFRKNPTKTFNGKCLAIIRPFAKKGTIELKVESEGLPASTIHIEVE